MKNQFSSSYAKDIPGFVFYESYYNALSELKPRQRLAAITAIMEYAFEGKEPELSGTTAAVVSVILPCIDANKKRYLRKTNRVPKVAADKAVSDEAVMESASPNKGVENDKTQKSESHRDENKSNSVDAKNNDNCGVIINTNKNIKTNSNSNASSNTSTSSNSIASTGSSECSDTTPPSVARAKPSDGNTRRQSALCSEIISEYAGGDSELRSLLKSWLDIKKQRGQPITGESIRLNLEELTRITAGGDKKAYLREVIRRGWGTFFELEKKGTRSDGGGGKGRNPGKSSRGDRESSFDIEEFDRFTLGISV